MMSHALKRLFLTSTAVSWRRYVSVAMVVSLDLLPDLQEIDYCHEF